ncbi:MAG: hypothetical protein ABIK62_03185 [candidate division WOR-3 bacterium]
MLRSAPSVWEPRTSARIAARPPAWPNPCSGILRLGPNPDGVCSARRMPVALCDATGRICLQSRAGLELDLRMLSDGPYFLVRDSGPPARALLRKGAPCP